MRGVLLVCVCVFQNKYQFLDPARDSRVVRCEICSVQLLERLPEKPCGGKLGAPFISMIALVLIC